MCHKSSSSGIDITRRQVVQMIGTAPLLAGGLLAFADTRSAFAASTSVPATLAPGGELDQYVKQLADQDLFSGTLLVARGDKPVLLRAYGMANKECIIPNSLQTIYATASITKSFTATAVAQLAQRKRLSFTDPIGKYLSGFPADVANTVTIHQLLTHTSGLGNYSGSSAYQTGLATWNSADEVMNGVLEIVKQETLKFTPGTDFSYSNSGYIVLGAIVAKVSKMDYYDYIHRHIFKTAGMDKSRFYTKLERERMQNIAQPYTTDRMNPGSYIDASHWQGFIGTPAANAFTTVEDLMRFCQALLRNRLLNPSLTELLMAGKVDKKPGEPTPERSDKYAYGLTDTLLNGTRLVWHSGSVLGGGVTTQYTMFPTLGWKLVILSNYDKVQSFKDLVAKAEGLIIQA